MTNAELAIALDADAFTRFASVLPEKDTKRANVTVDEAYAKHARHIVYDCESFNEFFLRSALPYNQAVAVWEIAWENYEKEENRVRGN